MSLLRIGGKKLSLVVLPPGGSIHLGDTDGAKVIYGGHILFFPVIAI
jgi:hypothetical protein